MAMSSESYIRKLVEENTRLGQRKFDEFREVKLEKGVIKTAEGSLSLIFSTRFEA